ncbi:MAG: hypothetical protein ACFE9T_10420 [Promethearchaeota archaeon]
MVEKNFMKIFVVGVLLIIVGVILVMSRNLYETYADPDTPGELERLLEALATMEALAVLFLQLGMLFFALSTFVAGVIDESLSPEVRRGCVLASSIAIIGLAILLILGA